MQNQKRYQWLSLEIRAEIKRPREAGEDGKYHRPGHARVEQALALPGLMALINYSCLCCQVEFLDLSMILFLNHNADLYSASSLLQALSASALLL